MSNDRLFFHIKYNVDGMAVTVYILVMNYKICEANYHALVAKLARLSKKLVTIGASPITFTVTKTVDEPHPDDASKRIRYYEIEVSGDTPKHNGWEFLATIVHTDEGNIFRSVPGYIVPLDFRDKLPMCDHCHTNRQRRDTYVVRHVVDGTVKQVGSTCLQDFLMTPPGRLTKAADLLLNAYSVCEAATDKAWLGGSNALSTYRIDLDTYLQNVAAVVLSQGRYVTRKLANELQTSATSDVASSVMSHRGDLGHEDRFPITEAATKLAIDAREWVLRTFSPALEDPDDMSEHAIKNMVIGSFKAANKNLSDFEHNLLSAARAEAIEPRLCGIAAYIIEAFRRSQPRKEATQLNEAGLHSIFAMFDKAKETLKYPVVRLANENGQRLNLSLAGIASKNAGFVYVKSDAKRDSTYFGKISPQGRFFGIQGCPAEIETLLQAFADDPEGIAKKYGKLTGCCSFCGRKLTDDRSTEQGYGPVCAEKFGLNWGTKIRQEATVAA